MAKRRGRPSERSRHEEEALKLGPLIEAQLQLGKSIPKAIEAVCKPPRSIDQPPWPSGSTCRRRFKLYLKLDPAARERVKLIAKFHGLQARHAKRGNPEWQWRQDIEARLARLEREVREQRRAIELVISPLKRR
jgi:hypothetical protein